MARSKRIYILLNELAPEPVSAFTVKHECVSALVQLREDGIPDELMLWAIPDGSCSGSTIRVSAVEWLEQEDGKS